MHLISVVAICPIVMAHSIQNKWNYPRIMSSIHTVANAITKIGEAGNMSKCTDFDRRMFDLGFAAGVDIDEDLPVIELQSRVVQWQIGFSLGRGFALTAKAGKFDTCAMTVGRLGALYGIDLEALLDAIGVWADAQRDAVRRAYDAK
jgi:hypothetical protein